MALYSHTNNDDDNNNNNNKRGIIFGGRARVSLSTLGYQC
jgi:hypothetical protein